MEKEWKIEKKERVGEWRERVNFMCETLGYFIDFVQNGQEENAFRFS